MARGLEKSWDGLVVGHLPSDLDVGEVGAHDDQCILEDIRGRLGHAGPAPLSASSRAEAQQGPITGVVTVTPRQAGSARGVRVELVLAEHVPARAAEPPEEDRHAATVITAVSLAEHVDLEPGGTLRFPFELRAPLPLPAPSLSTPEFALRWLLRAVPDRPLRPDPTTAVQLWATTAP